MRVLVATDQIDPRDGGFCFTVPGELVIVPTPCDKSGCGCRWSFAGLASTSASTLAEVADRPDLDAPAYSDLDGDPWLAEVAASHEPGTCLVGWFPRGDDAQILPLSEWIDRYGLSVQPEGNDETL